MAERIERKKQYTPILFLKYATLGVPYFHEASGDKKGSYSVTLRMTEQEHEDFMAKFDPVHEELEAAAVQALPKGKKAKRHPDKFIPIEPEVDRETGDDTGFFIVKLGHPAQYESKRKPGDVVKITPKVFDKWNKPVSEDDRAKIGYGSMARACFSISPFITSEGYLRMIYRLEAVQIIDLVERDGEGSSPFSAVVDDDAFMSNDSAASVSSTDNEDL